MSQRRISKSLFFKTLCVPLFGCGPKIKYLQPMPPAFYENLILNMISLFEKAYKTLDGFESKIGEMSDRTTRTSQR